MEAFDELAGDGSQGGGPVGGGCCFAVVVVVVDECVEGPPGAVL